MNAKEKILLLTYAKFAYMQNLRIRKSWSCEHGLKDEKKEDSILTENIEAVLKSTHNICFRAQKENNVNPCYPNFTI